MGTILSTRAQFTLRQRFEVSTAARVEAALADTSRTFAVGSGIRNLLAAGFEALDLLGIGLIVCGADGRLLVINQTAERTVRAKDGLEMDSDGRLRTTVECDPPFGELLQRVAEAKGEGEVALAVRRSSAKRPLTLLLRSSNGHPRGAGPVSPAALVLILDSALPANTVEAELRQLYGLTHTETRLAKLLMEGLTLDDCCAGLGIRRTTGRMHLRNLFAKIGVRRQSELVSLLMKSIGLGPRRQ